MKTRPYIDPEEIARALNDGRAHRMVRPAPPSVIREAEEADWALNRPRHIRIGAEPSVDEGIYIIAGLLAGAFVAGVLLWILLP